MDWLSLRDAYKVLFLAAKQHGETQETIAQRGGLKRQNTISKMLQNRNLGPQVETFIRAIEGLGLKPSAFFKATEEKSSTEVITAKELAALVREFPHLGLRSAKNLATTTASTVVAKGGSHGGQVSTTTIDLDALADQVLVKLSAKRAAARHQANRKKQQDAVDKPRAHRPHRRKHSGGAR